MLRGVPLTKLQGVWSGHSTMPPSAASSGGLYFLLQGLLLQVLLEFQKRDSLRNTYCMHMHKINIMGA
jgi:hypothetical protein